MNMDINLALLLATGAALCAGCLIPNRCLPPLPNDKFLHFSGFGILSILALRLAHDARDGAAWLLGVFVVGVLIECLQMLVPDRGFCWRDIGANTAGIVFAGLCAHVYGMF